jgi:hypothetical protein
MSLFGRQNSSSSFSLFDQPSFNNNNSSNLFGGNSNNSQFGNSLFGNNSNQTANFANISTSSGLFGNYNNNTTNSTFTFKNSNTFELNNNNQKLKSIGLPFNGYSIEEKDTKFTYASISVTPDFSALSFEEIRNNDYVFAKTGSLPQQPILNNKNNLNFGLSSGFNNSNSGGLFGNANNNGGGLFGNQNS